MKRLLPIGCAVALVFASPAQASPTYTLLGAALGAAAGFVVANNVDGISREVAVPVMAVIGGVIGNQVNQRMKDRHRGVTVQAQQAQRPGPPYAMPDPQPGVDLIKISILNSNGIRTDVPLLRIKDRYVGPQGEEYPSLPTTEQLSKRYGM